MHQMPSPGLPDWPEYKVPTKTVCSFNSNYTAYSAMIEVEISKPIKAQRSTTVMLTVGC